MNVWYGIPSLAAAAFTFIKFFSERRGYLGGAFSLFWTCLGLSGVCLGGVCLGDA